jgi:hypothetical protein
LPRNKVSAHHAALTVQNLKTVDMTLLAFTLTTITNVAQAQGLKEIANQLVENVSVGSFVMVAT